MLTCGHLGVAHKWARRCPLQGYEAGLPGADSGIAVVGDSVAELTAAQGADLFIGFRGFREEAELAARVAWVVRDYSQLTRNLRQYQVAFIGSGQPALRTPPCC